MSYFEFWHWWALALIFVVVEAIMPSGVFASLAIAGGIMGALYLYYPDMTIQAQLGGFAAFTMVLSYITTYFYRRKLGSHNSVKHAAAEHMGKELELSSAIQNGFGEITINGTIWGLKGPELKKGSKVKIIGLDGDLLVVRPINSKSESSSQSI